MSRRWWNRTEMLTAIVAAFAVLVGPAAAYATCCCVTAASGEAKQCGSEPALSCCASEQATVIQTPVIATSRSCCAPPSGPAVGDSAACSQPAVALKVTCRCEGSCCKLLVTDSAAILVQPGQQVTPVDWDASPAALLAQTHWDLISRVSDFRREPSFLSAQARCAMLCRWLN